MESSLANVIGSSTGDAHTKTGDSIGPLQISPLLQQIPIQSPNPNLDPVLAPTISNPCRRCQSAFSKNTRDNAYTPFNGVSE